MSNLNDKKILTLKRQITEKKERLNEIQKFSPVTNCSIEIDGVRHNLNVLTKEGLTLLLVKLNIYLVSSEDLIEGGVIDEFTLSGYPIIDWMEDIKNKLAFLGKKEEEMKLKIMESKLDKMLSEEKKTELELEDMAKELGL